VLNTRSKKDLQIFINFISKVKSVIVYRASPAQKAEIVAFIKHNIEGSFTLSIGDGSNDVNMIQTAHVGIGLYGKEGEQAASFSDYAIPEFKHLRRLMFVHGRGVGVKTVNFLAWYNYKSVLYSMISIFCNTNNGFSGVSLF
jgi:P-type E1-E2 ATPase